MSVLGFISWDVNPNIIESPMMIRYYGLLWAISFFLGFYMVKKMIKNEGGDPELADKFLTYTLIGGVLGARLGHVFFYDWDYYKDHLIEIPKVWNGGLASHGGAIGIIISTWILSRRVTKKSIFWSLDKIVVVTAIAGSLIRVGNLMNSEIIGQKSDAASAFFFEYQAKDSMAGFFDTTADKVNIKPTGENLEKAGFSYPLSKVSMNLPVQSDQFDMEGVYEHFYHYKSFYYYPESEKSFEKEAHYFVTEEAPELVSTPNGYFVSFTIAMIPRIPTQIWEAASYLLIFLLLFIGYWKMHWYKKQGMLFGMFLVLVFAARFIIEFWKEHQTLSDDAALNMGQWLSIPAVFAGLVIMFLSSKNKLEKQ